MPAAMKSPEGAAFLAMVMTRVGASNPTELSSLLGGEWERRDQLRKLYKWAAGESAPNFQGTIALLKLAQMLTEEAAAPGVFPVSPSTPDRLGALEAKLDRQGRASGKALKGIEAQLSYIRALLEPRGREATEDQ